MTYKWTQMIYNDLQNISDVSLPESQVIMYVSNDIKVYSKYSIIVDNRGRVNKGILGWSYDISVS
jgi:hypothetical protein